MDRRSGGIVYSASDLVNFLGCRALTALDCVNLNTRLPAAPDDPTAKLLQEKGFAHESGFLKSLREKGLRIVEIAGKSPEEKARQTTEALKGGADVVFQAAFLRPPWLGYADFLLRVEEPSELGNFGYEVYDTKLARHAYPEHLVQVGFYNQLLSGIQGRLGRRVHIVLGDDSIQSFVASEIDGFIALAKERFAAYVDGLKNLSSLDEAWKSPRVPYPISCETCNLCRWRDICTEKRLRDDHLSQVANATKKQIARLEAAGVKTMTELAKRHGGPIPRVPKMPKETLEKLVAQAALQQEEKRTGRQRFELLAPFDKAAPPPAGDRLEKAGLFLLPKPDAGDLFFDMEGDPYEGEGLEYLFGVSFMNGKKDDYKAFWAHDAAEEKRAFEAFIDLATERVRKSPGAHIFHYAHYEPSHLRRLASRHATREKELDDLLREERFVDLYKVVRGSVRISKDNYSIKKIEAFYGGKREGEVRKGDDSIVAYEGWKVSQDSTVLKSIEDYNREDCVSTAMLRKWLLEIAPKWIPAKNGGMPSPIEDAAALAPAKKGKEDGADDGRESLDESLAELAQGRRKSPLAGKEVFDLLDRMDEPTTP